MVLVGFKPDLDDQLVSFSAVDSVGLVIWPVKIVPEITYYVLSGKLGLYTTTAKIHSISYRAWASAVVAMIIILKTLCNHISRTRN